MGFSDSREIPEKILKKSEENPKKTSTFFQKALDKSVALCYNIVVPLMNEKKQLLVWLNGRAPDL